MMQKVKTKPIHGGKIHYPDDWLFNEYMSLFKMYIGYTNINFNPNEIKKIRVLKKNDEYILIGQNGKKYIINIGKDSTHVQVYNQKKLIYDEKINM